MAVDWEKVDETEEAMRIEWSGELDELQAWIKSDAYFACPQVVRVACHLRCESIRGFLKHG